MVTKGVSSDAVEIGDILILGVPHEAQRELNNPSQLAHRVRCGKGFRKMAHLI